MSLKITINGHDEVSAKLSGLASKLSRPAAILKPVGEALFRTTRERFTSQSDPSGKPWAKLRPLTVQARGAAGPILDRNSGMSGLKNRISFQVSGNTLRLGPSGMPQDAVLQFGATIVPKKKSVLAIPLGPKRGGRNGMAFAFAKKVTIPPRPYIGFGPKDEKAALDVIETLIEVESNGR